jgi:hypothetical protein
MPMIDVYAAAGTFGDPRALAQKLASELMAIEQVPDLPMFRHNTAAFIHDLPAGSLSNVDGDANYVRIQVLTNAGALDRGKQLAVVEQLTRIAAEAAGAAVCGRLTGASGVACSSDPACGDAKGCAPSTSGRGWSRSAHPQGMAGSRWQPAAQLAAAVTPTPPGRSRWARAV